MATRVKNVLDERLSELRYEPTAKRIRAQIDGQTVIDSEQAVLVWEPRRVVPEYAVPEQDIVGEVAESTAAAQSPPSAPVLLPDIAFAAHTAEGDPVDIRLAGRVLAGFRLHHDELDGHVLLDFSGADTWLEEDDAVLGHPRDPFHRVDTRASSREVVVSRGGQTIARTSRPRLVFETHLPVRYYIPREDVLVGLEPSPTRTLCAYKGEASHWSSEIDGDQVEDIAWDYLEPLEESLALKGHLAFYDDKVDIAVVRT